APVVVPLVGRPPRPHGLGTEHHQQEERHEGQPDDVQTAEQRDQLRIRGHVMRVPRGRPPDTLYYPWPRSWPTTTPASASLRASPTAPVPPAACAGRGPCPGWSTGAPATR